MTKPNKPGKRGGGKRGGGDKRGGKRRDDDRRGPRGGGPPRFDKPTSADRNPDEDEATQRKKRSLTSRGGAIRTRGNEELAGELGRALEQAGVEEPNTLTHGFHTWPARMHPAIARHCIELMSSEGERILDPFCGGGTVVLEAMVAGRRPMGIDLNPLALRVAATRCELRDAKSRERFVGLLDAIAAASEEKVRARVDSRAPVPRQHVRFYQGHILKEMAGLHATIAEVADERDRASLEMVFSALVVKFSYKRSETAGHTEKQRLRKGLVTEFFHRKGNELVRGWESLYEVTPRGTRAPLLLEGDARLLHTVMEKGEFPDLIVTSPPYGGTYDYADQHVLRYPWLGMSKNRFERREMGARRDMGGEDAQQLWDEQVGEVLKGFSQRLRPGGYAVMLVGDAQLGDVRVEADEHLADIGARHGFTPLAAASQARPDWSGRRSRREHLVVLKRV